MRRWFSEQRGLGLWGLPVESGCCWLVKVCSCRIWVISFMLEGECIGVTWTPLLAPLGVNLQFTGVWAVKKGACDIRKQEMWGYTKHQTVEGITHQLWYWVSSEENTCLLSSVSLPQKKERMHPWLKSFHQHCRGSVFLWPVSVAGWSRLAWLLECREVHV